MPSVSHDTTVLWVCGTLGLREMAIPLCAHQFGARREPIRPTDSRNPDIYNLCVQTYRSRRYYTYCGDPKAEVPDPCHSR